MTASGEHRVTKAFISYSHKDTEFWHQLEPHLHLLKYGELLETWIDSMLLPGDEFDDRIAHHLDDADIIIFLVSSDFAASRYCREVELPRALARQKAGLARIVPIIVRRCLWRKTPLGIFTALPKDGQSIKSFDDRDEAYTYITEQLELLILKLNEDKQDQNISAILNGQTLPAHPKQEPQTFTYIEKLEFIRGTYRKITELFDRSADRYTTCRSTEISKNAIHIHVDRHKQSAVTLKLSFPPGAFSILFVELLGDGDIESFVEPYHLENDDHQLFFRTEQTTSGENYQIYQTPDELARNLWSRVNSL